MNVSGEPLLSPGLAIRALLSRSNQSDLASLLGGPVTLLDYGRTALGTTLANIGTGYVLLPAYICDTVVHELQAVGREHRYYPLGQGYEPDWSWLDAKVTRDDSVLLLVHYFGFPADATRARKFCDDRGLMLVEDCAHAFLTAVAGRAVGRTGDVAIYSWRKFLSVANGGAALQRAGPTFLLGAGRAGLVAAARALVKWAVFKSGSRVARRLLAPSISDEGPSRSFALASKSAAHSSRGPDWSARRLLAAELPRLADYAARRRANYRSLLATIRQVDRIRVLTPELDPSSVPWCLPVLVESRAARGDLLETLLREGIGTWNWPDLPQDVSAMDWPEVHDLADRTLCLPVHQDLDGRHIQYVSDTVAAWALTR